MRRALAQLQREMMSDGQTFAEIDADLVGSEVAAILRELQKAEAGEPKPKGGRR